MVLCTCASDALAAEQGLTLVKEGQPVATIVIAASPTDNARSAATELQKYLEKMTGARLAVATDAAPPAGTLVLVGRSRVTDAIADLEIPSGRTKDLREEGFVIRTLGVRLVLAGNDEPPYLGTRYAVVEFLHRQGVRWFMPGTMGEVIPQVSSITVEVTNLVQRPDFPMRNWWEHARRNMAAECREWKIHNKMNPDVQDAFGVPADGSIKRYLPKNGMAEHPDWYAVKRDGTRDPDHPCTTSEGMIQSIVGRVKAEARAGARLSAFAPVDGNPRCWCERCEKIGNSFDGYGANERDPVPESSASNEWFYFVNRILAEVNREFPEYIIATNGYANRDIAPELPPDVVFNPSKNLVVMFANIGACTIHAYDDPKCWQMRRQGQMIRQWCTLSDKVWIYNYNYTMLVNKGTITPMVHRLRRNIPLLREWGLLGFHDQDEADWALTGIPTRLVRARLEWDVRTDVDAILDDFYTKWFGAAAAPMKRYYDALEEAFEKAPQHGHEDVILNSIYTDALMATLDSAMSAAESAGHTGTERSHIRIERAIYDHLREFVKLQKAKAAGRFADAARCAARMVATQEAMNELSPFLGWHPYKAYECDWERKRMEKTAALIDGAGGQLVAMLPEQASFRLDPFDDGRFERWQDTGVDLAGWKTLLTTAGWDAQGFHDASGRPYKGVAWYAFDVDVDAVPENTSVYLHAPAVVNEAWLWVNGRYAGHRPYKMPWFRPQPLNLEVTRLLNPGARNRVVLRVLCNFDVWGANGVYERMFLYAAHPQTAPAK